MTKVEDLEKKIVRLKKKLAGLKNSPAAEGAKTETGSSVRLWHKRLKRAQRRKTATASAISSMKTKQAKKKTEEQAQEAAKAQEPSA